MQIYDKKRPFINRQILIDLKRMQELRDVDEVKNFIKDLWLPLRIISGVTAN